MQLQISPHSSHLDQRCFRLFFHLTASFRAAAPRDQTLPTGFLAGSALGCCVPGQGTWPAWKWGVCVPLLISSAPLGTPSKPLSSLFAWTGQKLKRLFLSLANNLEAKSSPGPSLAGWTGNEPLSWAPPPPGMSPPLQPPALQLPAAPSCRDTTLLLAPWSPLRRGAGTNPPGHLHPRHRRTARIPLSTGGDSWGYPSRSDLCVWACARTCVSA